MTTSLPEADLNAIAARCESAVEIILSAAETVMAQARAVEPLDSGIAATLILASQSIFEACNFQDIVGQLVERLLHGPSSNSLLQGPAIEGGGASQADVDVLWTQPDAY